MAMAGIYFFHIPKTAGVSFWKVLDGAFPGDKICPWWLWDQLVGIPRDTLTSWDVFRGHFLSHLSPYLSRPLKTFTLLRRPIERTVSHYYHVRRAPDHPFHGEAMRMSLREFCLDPSTRHMVENYQAAYLAKSPCNVPAVARGITPDGLKRFELQETLQLPDHFESAEGLLSAARERLATFTAVGTTETFSESIQRIGAALGVVLPPSVEPQNVNPGRVSVDALDRATQSVIQELTEVDQRLYDLTVNEMRQAR